jgi:hypothetical protein
MIQDILVEKTAIKSNRMYVDGRNYIVNFTGNDQVFIKPGFHTVVTVVKIKLCRVIITREDLRIICVLQVCQFAY